MHRDERLALARRIEELAGTHPRYGYRRIWAPLRREGWRVNKNAVHAESFHSKLRDEFPEREGFEGVSQARALGALWEEEYDTERPHSSSGYMTPAGFAATCVRSVPIEEDPLDRPSTEQTPG